MTNIYNANINYLSDNIKDKLLKIETGDRVRVLAAKTGELTAKVKYQSKELYLCSGYNPIKEAIRFADNQDIKSYKSIVLFGFGLGYHVEELLKKVSQKQDLIIVILNPDIFKLCLEKRRLTFLKDNRIEFIFEMNKISLARELEKKFKSLKDFQTKIIVHEQSIKVVKGDYLFIKDKLEEIKINNYNAKRLGRYIKKNKEDNLKLLEKFIGIKSFKDKFRGIPSFIVSAGPSLDKNICKLKMVGSKGIIIAVDSSLTPLMNNKIKPDFVVSTEPIDLAYDGIFANYPELDIPLLHILETSHKLLVNYKGAKIVGLKKNSAEMNKLDKEFSKGRVLVGGTVALTALDFAVLLGSTDIILLGQDFSYGEDGVTHAAGTFYNSKKKDIAIMRKVEGVKGKEVYTTSNLYLYLRSFEKYIRKNPGPNFVDATEGGAKIAGTRVMTLENAIEEYCNRVINKNGKILNIINRFICK